jgi:hypothetical protein
VVPSIAIDRTWKFALGFQAVARPVARLTAPM